MQKGKVSIIGVGPGDYKLMTLKAVECISKADVIVYDRLIGSKVLEFASKEAEFINVGKLPDFHAVTQDNINNILVKKALEGKNVARVKGGDPFIFGRGGEEAEALIEHDIKFEIVPGITSAIAVPAYAGIPVTHRDYSSSLHIITGHERPDRENSSVNYEALAKVEGTLIFLMGVKNLEEITSKLIEYGKDPKTQAAIIERGTTGKQRTVKATLESIAGAAKENAIKSPAITVVGGVVDLMETLSWFPNGSLSGKTVIVTRAREQASLLVEEIENRGGEVIEFPTIKITEPEEFNQLDEAIDHLSEYNWLLFTSTNSVEAFFKRLRTLRKDIRSLVGIKIGAVGSTTTNLLAEMGINVDYMPEKYTSKDMLEGLLKTFKVDGSEGNNLGTKSLNRGIKILYACSDISGAELTEELKSDGIILNEIAVYRTQKEIGDSQRILELLMDKKVDFITFTSSSTVQNFVSAIGESNIELLLDTKLICIGPVTANTAHELGLQDITMADNYTIAGMVDKLEEIARI